MKTLQAREGVLARHLRRLPLFAELDAADLKELVCCSMLRLHDRDERLFEQGSAPCELLALVDGTVRVVLSVSGGEKVIHLASAPCLLAEVPVLMGRPFPASAVCNEPCTLMAIPRQDLRDLARRDVDLLLRLLGASLERLRELTSSLASHGQRGALSRVASYLLGLAGSGALVELPAAKKDVASYLGLTPEAFSRALAVLRSEGAIEVEGQRLRVLDRSILARAFEPEA